MDTASIFYCALASVLESPSIYTRTIEDEALTWIFYSSVLSRSTYAYLCLSHSLMVLSRTTTKSSAQMSFIYNIILPCLHGMMHTGYVLVIIFGNTFRLIHLTCVTSVLVTSENTNIYLSDSSFGFPPFHIIINYSHPCIKYVN